MTSNQRKESNRNKKLEKGRENRTGKKTEKKLEEDYILPSTMVSLLPFLLLLLLPPSTIANDPYKLCEGDNFSTNTTFQSNLNLLLSSLSSKTNSTFATNTQGSPPDIIFGLFLCRGDVNRSTCQNCIRNATRNILQLCPYSRQATVWYDTCQLRYSDLSFFATFHEDNPVNDSDKQKAKDSETFNRIRRQLFEKLSDEAANNSTLMFATGTADIGVSENVMYGLVQCTRDLSKEGCHLCLQENFYDMSHYMESQNAIGVRILAKSCNFRFATYKFFEGDPVISLSSRPNAEADGRGNRKIIIVGIVISLLVASLLVASVFILSVCIIFRRRQAKSCQGIADPNEISMESLYFELPVLKAATSNFSDVNKLGQGGFGAVYKGMLPNGQDIAVKRLSANSKQGIEELKNELLLVAKLQHRNLVRLQGVCLEGGEKLLVYEYMPNGSLDKFLFDPIKCKELDWERRFKIIEGIARGIHYLHEESPLKVIHRDLKPSNILLDANMKPKISDFGLARLFGGDESQGITCRVVGTFGYMAPEYARRGRFSTKLDVYSYGILVLEIVTGRKIGSFTYDSERGQDLLSYTWMHWTNGTAIDIIDPSLGENYPINEMLRCIQIGLLCTQDDAADRPSMSSVFLILNSPSMPLKDPLLPAYLIGSSMTGSDVSSKGSSIQSCLGHTDISSTSNSQVSAGSMGSSQHSIMPNQPETRQKGKEMVHTLTSNRTFNRSREQALPSRLSQTAPAGHPNRN